LTFFGLGSALKASLTPRIGSPGAISTRARIDAVMGRLGRVRNVDARYE
jgi:hypothetical protein